MSSLLARTGRSKQRYEGRLRLVAGCIPYKLEKAVEGQDQLRVLMVSSPNRDDLVFPKGGWEDDECIRDAACREAWEEAGVKGVLSVTELGVWEFKSKTKQSSCSQEGGCRGLMFALKVIEELDSWPEMKTRERKWLTTKEAFRLCRYDWMREALKRLLIALSNGGIMGNMLAEISTVLDVGIGPEHHIISSIYYGKPPSAKTYEKSCEKCVVHG